MSVREVWGSFYVGHPCWIFNTKEGRIFVQPVGVDTKRWHGKCAFWLINDDGLTWLAPPRPGRDDSQVG